jgi:hypothetical protein
MSKITKIPSFQTTDGRLHSAEDAACDHQDVLDLGNLLQQATGGTVDVHSRAKVVNFILGNSDEIDRIVKARRARKARFAKKSQPRKAIPGIV